MKYLLLKLCYEVGPSVIRWARLICIPHVYNLKQRNNGKPMDEKKIILETCSITFFLFYFLLVLFLQCAMASLLSSPLLGLVLTIESWGEEEHSGPNNMDEGCELTRAWQGEECCDTTAMISIVEANNRVTTPAVVHAHDRDRHCGILTICHTCKKKIFVKQTSNTKTKE